MKQLLFVGVLTLVGVLGPFVYSPFYGVAVYYLFAVLRPQYIWQWSLPADMQWSRYVAIASILAAVGTQAGLLPRRDDGDGCRKTPVATNALMGVFFVWLIVTYVTAQNRSAADYTFTEYVKIFVMYAVACAVIRSVREVWILMFVAAGSLSYISYEVNVLYLVQHALKIQRDGYGGLDNNGAGLLLAMGVPLCVMGWDGMRSRWRWAVLAFVPVIVHAVLMTYSRGAMVSLLAVSPVLALRCRRRLQLAPFGAMMLLAIPILAGPEIQARFFTLKQNEVDESANARRASWAAAWAIAKDNPIFGVGIRNSPLLSHRYGADMEGRVIHSQYLQIAADNGFVGLALYLGLLGSTFYNGRRVRKLLKGLDTVEADRLRAVANGVEASLATFCVGAAFLSLEIFELPYLLVLLGAQAASMASDVEARGWDEEGPMDQVDEMPAGDDVTYDRTW